MPLKYMDLSYRKMHWDYTIALFLIGYKFCRLDIHMIVDGQQTNLEVQVEDEGDYPERVLFHWARTYSNALPAGGKYSELPRTIIISILNFSLFSEWSDFHSEFQPLEVTYHKPLTDKQILHFFELPKLPESIEKNDLLLLWLALFKANTAEELKELNALEVPELSEAISAYYNVTASSEFREIERLRAKAQHDEAQALHNARREARQEEKHEFARNMLADGEPIEKIIKYTGLTSPQIESLRDTY